MSINNVSGQSMSLRAMSRSERRAHILRGFESPDILGKSDRHLAGVYDCSHVTIGRIRKEFITTLRDGSLWFSLPEDVHDTLLAIAAEQVVEVERNGSEYEVNVSGLLRSPSGNGKPQELTGLAAVLEEMRVKVASRPPRRRRFIDFSDDPAPAEESVPEAAEEPAEEPVALTAEEVAAADIRCVASHIWARYVTPIPAYNEAAPRESMSVDAFFGTEAVTDVMNALRYRMEKRNAGKEVVSRMDDVILSVLQGLAQQEVRHA